MLLWRLDSGDDNADQNQFEDFFHATPHWDTRFNIPGVTPGGKFLGR
jgi:hypothetical protein